MRVQRDLVESVIAVGTHAISQETAELQGNVTIEQKIKGLGSLMQHQQEIGTPMLLYAPLLQELQKNKKVKIVEEPGVCN